MGLGWAAHRIFAGGARLAGSLRRVLARHAAALVLLAGILAWRFFQVRGMALPAWVDSVHHALLVRVLLEHGPLPGTWGPYLPQVPLFYHFGFHLSAAAVARVTGLTGIDLGRAVLIAGQLWQGVLALAVYILAYRLWGDRSRAVIALLLVGFFCEMPAFYSAWGRYTLLAGLALMALTMAVALPGARANPVALALLLAATSITHQYAFLLLLLFLALFLAVMAGRRRRLVVGTAAGLLLAAPWQWHVWRLAQRYVGVSMGPESVGYNVAYLARLLGPARNVVVWSLALLGAVLIVRRLLRDYDPAHAGRYALVGWALILMALLGPWSIAPFRPDYVAIVLFLPAALLAAEPLRRLRLAVLVGILIVLVAWGAWQTRSVVRPDLSLADTDDLAAMRWLDARTSPDAVFLIDTAPWLWSWRGTDGGWWILPLTGRQTVLPPIPYEWGPPGAVQEVKGLAERAYVLAQSDGPAYCDELAALMRAAGATHYYTHSPRPAACPTVRAVYHGVGGLAVYAAAPWD